MIKTVRIGGSGALLALAMCASAQAAEPWTVDDTSRIGFTAFQKGQPVEGQFQDFSADITFDRDDLEAGRIAVEIDVASASTGHKDRDAALRSPSFFHAEQWPTAGFVSEDITGNDDGTYEAAGTLTIRDVSEDLVLPFTLTIEERADQLVARAEGEVTISRLAYGVGQGDFASTDTISDDVVIKVAIDATRPR